MAVRRWGIISCLSNVLLSESLLAYNSVSITSWIWKKSLLTTGCIPSAPAFGLSESSWLLPLTNPRNVYAGLLGSSSQYEVGMETINIVEFEENTASTVTFTSSNPTVSSGGRRLTKPFQLSNLGITSSFNLMTRVTSRELAVELVLDTSVLATLGGLRLCEKVSSCSCPEMLEAEDKRRGFDGPAGGESPEFFAIGKGERIDIAVRGTDDDAIIHDGGGGFNGSGGFEGPKQF